MATKIIKRKLIREKLEKRGIDNGMSNLISNFFNEEEHMGTMLEYLNDIEKKGITEHIVLLNADRITRNKKIKNSKLYWKISDILTTIKLKIITYFQGTD